jgi:hypothetical protein
MSFIDSVDELDSVNEIRNVLMSAESLFPADGTVLAIGEVMAVEQGRRFTQKTLQAAMDEQIKTLEKTFAFPVLHLWVEKGSPRSQGSSPDHSGGRRATVSDLSEVCSL